jgi:hypothetical protein
MLRQSLSHGSDRQSFTPQIIQPEQPAAASTAPASLTACTVPSLSMRLPPMKGTDQLRAFGSRAGLGLPSLLDDTGALAQRDVSPWVSGDRRHVGSGGNVKVAESAEHLGVAPVLHYDLVFEGLKFHGTIVGRRHIRRPSSPAPNQRDRAGLGEPAVLPSCGKGPDVNARS